MNHKPVSYKQYDKRWANNPYRTKNESSTIKTAGCGPTCAAMCIATLGYKDVTPAETAEWAMKHGYKAYQNGTAWAYFEPQLAHYGILCHRVDYKEAMTLMAQGWYVIAAMKRGLWTSGGHFILAWWADDKIRINDPASEAYARENGDPALFKEQSVAYWAVDASKYNKNGTVVPDITWNGEDGRIDSIKEVQKWLNRNYSAGIDEDGIYGFHTRKAIISSLQVEMGFSGNAVDGIAGNVTCRKLPVIKKGSSGQAVKLLQCVLVCLGYTEAYVDGCAGNGTSAAIGKAQKKYKLWPVDCVCGKNTWKKLLNVM